MKGTKVTARAAQATDAGKIHLAGHLELSNLDEVRTVSPELRGKQATIQIPRVKRCQIDVSSDVMEGQSLLVGCLPTMSGRSFSTCC
jgi:hypothetical protein